MKNSFFSKFTPKEPKFFPLLKQLSDVLSASSVLLVESLQHDLPTERADYYKQIKDMEREGDRLTHLIFDELSTTFEPISIHIHITTAFYPLRQFPISYQTETFCE